jgi:hypothetical protein
MQLSTRLSRSSDFAPTNEVQFTSAAHPEQIPYSGFGIASRALLMHAIVRVIRTVSFLAVVLPNSKTANCYARRFPRVPDGMWEYILTGISTLKGFGGCNDLILR